MVRRWTLSGIGDQDWPYPDDGGAFVIYDDYAALEAENARLRERIEQAPHDDDCLSLRCECGSDWHTIPGTRHNRHDFKGGPCNCWKSAP